MKGLEISEVNFSQVSANKDERTDSDFWTKQPIKNSKLKYEKIGNCLTTAQYGISIAMNEDNQGYPIYRMNEIHNMLCDFEVDKTADISSDEMQTFKLNDRDVLFNRTNSYEWVGRTGVYKKIDEREFIYASYLVRFVPNQSKLLPEYLATFLNSSSGIRDIKRRSRPSINQTNVNPEEVKEIEIPIFGLSFQNHIKDKFDRAFDLLKNSQIFYASVEELLVETLGLTNFHPSVEPINIKFFNTSFRRSGRLDAEYYQVKYEDWANAVQAYKHGSETIADICEVKDKNFTPDETKTYSYIELSDIDKVGGITGATIAEGASLPTRARRLVKSGDVLISSIEGSLSSCALVSDKYDGALCSTGFYVLRSKKINAETLLVLMKSEPMQALLKQGCSGTILTAINNEAFLSLPIPLIELSIQKKIAIQVQKSFQLKAESESLLNMAKRAVEIAIEQDEKAGVNFIKENS